MSHEAQEGEGDEEGEEGGEVGVHKSIQPNRASICNINLV